MRMILVAALTAALSFWQATPPSPPSPGTLALTGRVVTGSEADLRPVRRAKVTLTASSGPARVTDTDTKGVYRFDRLPAGDYKVSVQKLGFVKLEGAASPDATLTLVRGGAIEGTVADAAGDPTWNVVMMMARPTQHGRFDVRGLPPEDYLVVALPNVIGTEWQDPDFLQQLRLQATSFVLMEGEAKTLELKLKKRPS